ncbi:hypothetical protein E8E11_006943 [Didymella keratinophila]|nr:hypothetical protein E8E11_006943 [Didymella keratinophila]
MPMPSILVEQDIRQRQGDEKFYYPVYARFRKQKHGENRLGDAFDYDLDFCLPDESQVKDPESEMTFTAPFSYLQPANSSRFQSMVLFCALAHTNFEEAALPSAFLEKFREACATIADIAKHTVTTTPCALPAWTYTHVVVFGEDLSDDSDTEADGSVPPTTRAQHYEPSHDSAATIPARTSQYRREGDEVSRSLSRYDERGIDVEQFAEYQKLIERIRHGADIENGALKDENE